MTNARLLGHVGQREKLGHHTPLHSHFQVLACYKAPQIFPAVSYSSNPHLLHVSRKSHEHLQKEIHFIRMWGLQMIVL